MSTKNSTKESCKASEAKWRVRGNWTEKFFKTKKEANAYADEVCKERKASGKRYSKPRPEVEEYDHVKADPFSPSDVFRF